MKYPSIALIGKPNVGKSTLFNRLLGYRKAIVSPIAGTTRDRNFALVEGLKPYLLIDTGGIQVMAEDALEENILSQARMAIEEADLIVFLINAKEGATKADYDVLTLLRQSKKPVILTASHCDSGREDFSDLYRLGFGEPIAVSALHSTGIDDLEEKILSLIPDTPMATNKNTGLKLAIMGRPNVGKSSFINSIVGSERCIVSDIAGTTVDATDIQFAYEGEQYTLVDTAGLKRRGKRGKGIEKYSFLRSIRAAEHADVCVLLIDGEEGVARQDLHTADYILQLHAGVILVVNKWDLSEKGEESRHEFLHTLQHEFDFLSWAPVVFCSAKTGKNIHQIFPLARQIAATRKTEISTSVLNNWLEQVTHEHIPAGAHGRVPRLMYMCQIGTEPPHFLLFTRHKESLHFSYLRYLENKFRERFGFEGTAIRFELREGDKRTKARK